jgi:deoxyribonuclease-4
MPLFGAHMSIAGGLHKALLAATAHGCQTVQLFTASPQNWAVVLFKRPGKGASRWRAKELDPEAVSLFRQTMRRSRLRQPMAHVSYLINLASPEPGLFRQSLEAFIVEMERAERLGLRYLVMHPGSTVGGEVEEGLDRIAAALDEAHARCPKFRLKVLLETTAGQGSSLGHRFEHLAGILGRVKDPQRLGICLDTCHVFAAGYALAPQKEYRATLRAFDQLIGLGRLRAFHLNDSQKPLGSRVDRHAHIGRGELGVEPFRLLVNDRRFRNRPMVIETPKEDGEIADMDAVNLGMLRKLAE